MPTAFLITPFSSESADNEDLTVFTQVQEAVREAATMSGIQLAHPKESQKAGSIMDQVRNEIEHADIVIAILRKNWNIGYEVGFAHRAGRPVILIATSDQNIPFDVRPDRYLNYSEP